MPPLLLRSAGLVGVAGAIVAVISSEALFVEASPPASQAELMAASSVDLRAGEAFTPPTGAFALAPAAEEPVRIVALQAEPATVPLAAPAAAPARPAPSVPAAVPASEAVSSPAAEPRPEDAAIAAAREAVRQAAAPTRSPWPEHAVKCPRDWIAVDGSTAPGGAECGAAPLPVLASLDADEPALGAAALERASELAGLQFAPRIPLLRPEPPAGAVKLAVTAPRKSAGKGRASRPAGPPPKCGSSKRAKWRYVNKTPTWYCKG